MESLRNAATVAASYVGLTGTEEEHRENETNRIAGGDNYQNVATGTSQSGIEPVNGKRGRGEAGEPYDAGNMDGTSALGGSSAQNPSGYSSQSSTGNNYSSGTGLGSNLSGNSGLSGDGLTSNSNNNSGLTGSNNNRGASGTGLGSNNSSSQTSSEPIMDKVRQTFGVGGGDKQGTGLGSREDGPGYGTSSKNDSNSGRLGSAVGHGSNPDAHLYNSKNAPGLGGHRIGDDFTDSNTRHEGADRLPGGLGSDAAAGKAGHSSSGSTRLTSGLSSDTSRRQGDNVGYASGNTSSSTGETLARKAEEYLPGTGSHSGTQPGSTGRQETDYESSSHGASNASSLPVRTQDSSLTGEQGYSSSTGSGLTSGLTGSNTTNTGSGLTGSHSHHGHGLSDIGVNAEEEGYKPHGGHPIGAAAHSTDDGKATWLDYRNDPNLPVARANPADY